MRNDVAVNLKLDLARNRGQKIVYARQNDTKVFNLHIMLTNNGQVVDLSQAVACIMYIKKPNETEYANSMVRSGNELSYTLRTQDVDCLGETKAQVYIGCKDGSKFTSPVFTIQVYSDILNQDLNHVSVESENQYQAISDILGEALTTAEEAKKYADDSKQYVDDTKMYYEFAQALNESIVQINEEVQTAASTTQANKDYVEASVSQIDADLAEATNLLQNAITSGEVATNAAIAAKASEDAAKVSEDAAKASEVAAKASEDAAKASEIAAKASEVAAKATIATNEGILEEAKDLFALPSFKLDADGYLVDENSMDQYEFSVDSEGYLVWKGVA